MDEWLFRWRFNSWRSLLPGKSQCNSRLIISHEISNERYSYTQPMEANAHRSLLRPAGPWPRDLFFKVSRDPYVKECLRIRKGKSESEKVSPNQEKFVINLVCHQNVIKFLFLRLLTVRKHNNVSNFLASLCKRSIYSLKKSIWANAVGNFLAYIACHWLPASRLNIWSLGIQIMSKTIYSSNKKVSLATVWQLLENTVGFRICSKAMHISQQVDGKCIKKNIDRRS